MKTLWLPSCLEVHFCFSLGTDFETLSWLGGWLWVYLSETLLYRAEVFRIAKILFIYAQLLSRFGKLQNELLNGVLVMRHCQL